MKTTEIKRKKTTVETFLPLELGQILAFQLG